MTSPSDVIRLAKAKPTRRPKATEPERYWVALTVKKYLYNMDDEIGCLPVFRTREAAEKSYAGKCAIHCIESDAYRRLNKGEGK